MNLKHTHTHHLFILQLSIQLQVPIVPDQIVQWEQLLSHFVVLVQSNATQIEPCSPLQPDECLENVLLH